MSISLSPRHGWADEALTRYRTILSEDSASSSASESSTATALAGLLCWMLERDSLLSNDGGSGDSSTIPSVGQRVPVLLLARVLSEMRQRIAPHSVRAAPQRTHAWDVTCVTVLQYCLCPGTLKSTWERRILQLIASDLNGNPPYDGTDGTVIKLYVEAAAIVEAVTGNSIYQVRRRLQGNSLNVDLLQLRDEFGWTLLHHAAYNSCLDTMRYLIAEGVSPNSIDCQGSSVLHIAASRLHTDAISLLIQSGAARSIGVRDSRGDTPIEAFLTAIALSSWQLRLSPMQLANTAELLMRDPSIDLWVSRPAMASRDSASGNDYDLQRPDRRREQSLFLRLLWISDVSVAQTVVSLAVQSLREVIVRTTLANQSPSDAGAEQSDVTTHSLWPISDRVKAGIAQQQRTRMGTEPNYSSDNTFNSCLMSPMEADAFKANVRCQVRVAVAHALKKKRFRLLQLLLQTFDSLLDLFDVSNQWVDRSASIVACSSDVRKHHDFYFRCLELAVVSKSLRTVVAMLDVGQEKGIFSIAESNSLLAGRDVPVDTSAPSCFLNLVIAQSDPLLLRLVLERLGSSMDWWVTRPPCSMRYSDDSADDNDRSRFFGEMDLSMGAVLDMALDTGSLDKQTLELRLALFSPLSLACLLDDHVALETMLCRLDSPLGSGSGAIKGCSPVVCAALTGSANALGALQSHMGPRAFAYACRAQDAYGLTALSSLMHVLRLQHDHVGQSSLWGDLTSVVREDFAQQLFSQESMDESPRRSPSQNLFQMSATEDASIAVDGCSAPALGSPEVNRLLTRSGSGLLQRSDSSSAASPKGRMTARRLSADTTPALTSPVRISGKDGFSTPVKKSGDRGNRGSSARHSRYQPSSTTNKNLEHQQRVAAYRQMKKQNGDLHHDFGRGMFGMSGIRYGDAELRSLLDLLTPKPTFSSNSGHKVGGNEESIIYPPNVQGLMKRLVYLCEQLQRLAFPPDSVSKPDSPSHVDDLVNVRIFRPGVRYCHLTSGDVQMSLPERVVILRAAPARQPTLTDSDSLLPIGYLVEDIMSNLISQFPSLAELLRERRRRRARWYKLLRIGRRGVLSDIASGPLDIRSDLSSPPTSHRDMGKDETMEELFASILSSYSDDPAYSSGLSRRHCEPACTVLNFRSPTFLKKMT